MTNAYRKQVPDGAFRKRLTRRVDGQLFGFDWHGGEYIEVCRGEAFASPGEVINVWEPETDGPRYPRTVDGLNEAIDNWLDGYGAENLLSDCVNWP